MKRLNVAAYARRHADKSIVNLSFGLPNSCLTPASADIRDRLQRSPSVGYHLLPSFISLGTGYIDCNCSPYHNPGPNPVSDRDEARALQLQRLTEQPSSIGAWRCSPVLRPCKAPGPACGPYVAKSTRLLVAAEHLDLAVVRLKCLRDDDDHQGGDPTAVALFPKT